jgi:hypothetical protein
MKNLDMRRKTLLVLFLFCFLAFTAGNLSALENGQARSFVGQDLHLSGAEVISYQATEAEHSLVFRDGFSMSIGANRFTSDKAVALLETESTEFRGRVHVRLNVRIYLQGKISIEKGRFAKTTGLEEVIIEPGKEMVVYFDLGGEVFVTADKRESFDPRSLALYKRARAAAVPVGPRFVIRPEAMVPEWKEKEFVAEEPVKKPIERGVVGEPAEAVESVEPEAVPAIAVRPEEKKPKFIYPVNIAPAGQSQPVIESAPSADELEIETVTGRLYIWQKTDESGGLLELQADNTVIFRSSGQTGGAQPEDDDFISKSGVVAIYMTGDVLMTEDSRTIRADELYYDFRQKKAIIINAVMRNFDVKRGIPIYVRAAKLRQAAANRFTAEEMTLTSSEFYKPQISMTASDVNIVDTTSVDQREGTLTDSSFEAEMRDARFKVGQTTVFRWPYMRSNLQRPDVPIRSLSVGKDSIWGTSIETRWYLSRLLGFEEPEGVESTLALDHFSKRGVGGGAEIEYRKEDYYGRILGYVMRDRGEDRLGRNTLRRNIEPDQDIRGRFSWRHRQFLPNKWQLTTGVGWSSDEDFVEAFYRNEFNVGTEETYLHLKRIEDNRAVSILSKWRMNGFMDELQELPTLEFHLTGESLFDDVFTFYSDTQVSRMQQKIGRDHTTTQISSEVFSFVSHRSELDMPLQGEGFKMVPFVAGTFGYDDRSGFATTLVDGSNSGTFGEDQIWLGEAGVRLFPQAFWKVYPNAKSRLWDLNQLRHVVKPWVTAAAYTENDSAAKQRDTIAVGLSQRLQTKRGPADEQRTVDWMRLDVEGVWVDDPEDVSSTTGPDRFIWSRPIVPLRVFSAPDIFNGDLRSGGIFHRFEQYGPRRNYFGSDYIWRISDTTAMLSDMNIDMQSGVVQQFNIGFSRLCWPNLSYYIGSRYLRRIEVLNEKGSNAFTFAATYILDPRYTLVFAQQYDFDYSANIRSDITLVRKYHRINCAITYSADESLDRQAIVFSIWPQGVPEMAIGKRSYMGLGGSSEY